MTIPTQEGVTARRFHAGNGHRGGGTYARAFLGDGGVCHGGEAMQSMSRRWIGYCSEGASLASYAVRGMGGNAAACRFTLSMRLRAREEGRMANRPSYASRQEKRKTAVVHLSPAQRVAHVALVRNEHALSTALGLCLRILRWEGNDAAFHNANEASNGNFAPCTVAFAERRFISGDEPMQALVAVLHKQVSITPGVLNRAFFRIILLATRLNEYVHTELLIRLAQRPMLLLETRVSAELFTLLAELWWWRFQLKEAVDMRFWRSARLGNALTADNCPPPDEYMPDVWPDVRSFVDTVMSVDETAAGAMLAMDTNEWIAAVRRCVHGCAEVWGTVTARERAWYTFFAIDNVAQPAERDVPQPIGAGAMRGSLWQLEHLQELPNFNRRTQSIEQSYIQGVLAEMGKDVKAFEEATREAWEVWLPSFINACITDAHRRAEVREMLKKYDHLKEALVTAGPPPMIILENGQCDGCKAREGLVDQISRKGKLLSRARKYLGQLPQPKRILLLGTVWCKWVRSGTTSHSIASQWRAGHTEQFQKRCTSAPGRRMLGYTRCAVLCTREESICTM